MRIQPAAMPILPATNFEGRHNPAKLPKSLQVNRHRSAPKGLLISLVPITLFLSNMGIWMQTPAYKAMKLIKQANEEYRIAEREKKTVLGRVESFKEALDIAKKEINSNSIQENVESSSNGM